MRDLPTFIKGLHDYIRLALAPLIKRIDDLEGNAEAMGKLTAGSVSNLDDRVKALETCADENPMWEQVKAEWEAKFSQLTAQEAPNFAERVGEVVGKAYDDPNSWLASKDYVKAAVKAAIFPDDRVAQLVAEAVAAIEPPKGDKGEDGKSITLDDVRPMLESALELTLMKLALEVERRNTDRMQAWEANANATLQRAIDNIPKPKDALSVTDFSAKLLEDGRTLRVSLGDGEREKYADVRLGHVLDAGPWMPGKTYDIGDGVTCMGSYWIAKEQTDEQPTGESTAWRRAVSKGRDARRVDLPKQPSQPVRLTERD